MENVEQDPRNYLAAERTFLAWLRTGLALMGFGFVAARIEMGVSLPLGISLIILGVAVNICAALRHRRYIRGLDRGEFRPAFGWIFALSIAAILSTVGLAMAAYLARL